jgi:hypothetical protein
MLSLFWWWAFGSLCFRTLSFASPSFDRFSFDSLCFDSFGLRLAGRLSGGGRAETDRRWRTAAGGRRRLLRG